MIQSRVRRGREQRVLFSRLAHAGGALDVVIASAGPHAAVATPIRVSWTVLLSAAALSIHTMPLYDYYRAANRDDARALALLPGGPFSGREAGADVLALKNLDPCVVMGQLLAFILDVKWSPRLYESQYIVPTCPQPQGPDIPEDSPWFEGPWVEDLGVFFRDAFADVDDARLPEICERWLAIEELRGSYPAESAREAAEEFVALARRAREADQSLYCWMCL